MISTYPFAISDYVLSEGFVLKTFILIPKSVVSYSMSFYLGFDDPPCMYVCMSI